MCIIGPRVFVVCLLLSFLLLSEVTGVSEATKELLEVIMVSEVIKG